MAYLQRVENTKEIVVNFPIRNKLEVKIIKETNIHFWCENSNNDFEKSKIFCVIFCYSKWTFASL